MSNLFDDVFDLYWTDSDSGVCYPLRSKKDRTRELVLYMLDRTQQIFTWEGLPKTIPPRNLEKILQLHGDACITEVSEVPEGHGDPGLYAFFGGIGGLQNAYYEGTLYTIANPYLNFNAQLQIGVDCVRVRNDEFSQGLLPLFLRYGAMQNENEISMNMLAISYRISELISADDDRTYESAKAYLNDIVRGQFGVISSSEFFEGLRNDKATGGKQTIKDLIEYEQYLKASWYNEIGLNSNYNMKRERIVASEAEMTDDALIPLVDNMLTKRQEAVEEIKEMYGDRYDLDALKVSLNPIWDLDKMYVGTIPEVGRDGEEVEELPEDTEATNETETDENETEPTTETSEANEEIQGAPEEVEVVEEVEEIIEELEDISERLENGEPENEEADNEETEKTD